MTLRVDSRQSTVDSSIADIAPLSLEDVIQHSTKPLPPDSILKGRQDACPHNKTGPIVGAGFQPALQSRSRELDDCREDRLRRIHSPLRLRPSGFLVSVCE